MRERDYYLKRARKLNGENDWSNYGCIIYYSGNEIQ